MVFSTPAVNSGLNTAAKDSGQAETSETANIELETDETYSILF